MASADKQESVPIRRLSSGVDAVGTGTSNGTAGDATERSGNDATDSTEGSELGQAEISGQAEPKRRGRKPGSKNKTGSAPGKAAVLTPEKLAPKIEGAHAFAAAMLGIPLIQILPDESVAIAEALCDVASHYELPVSGKTLAWVNLIAVLGMVYGIRVAQWPAYKLAKQREAMNREREFDTRFDSDKPE